MTSPASELDLFRAVLRTASRPTAAWRTDGTLIECSASFAALLDTDPDAVAAERMLVVHPDDRDDVEEHLGKRAAGNLTASTLRVRLMSKTGSVIRTLSRLAPIVIGDEIVGEVLECLEWGSGLDATDALDQQAANYEQLLEQVDEVVFPVDDRAGLISANRATERLLGRTVEQMRHTPGLEMFFPSDLSAVGEIRERFNAGDRVPSEIQFRIRRPDGEVRWVGGSVLMQRDHQGKFDRAFFVCRDITEAKARERALSESEAAARLDALIDSLTELPNRRAFDEAIIACRADVDRGDHPVMVVLDLDQLKGINDQAGHAVGDEAIRTAARAIGKRIRDTDQAFRIGGDEFAVILRGGNAAAIEARLASPIPFGDEEPLEVSVGSASCGIDGTDPMDVFRVADERMYNVKRARRATRQP
jgi:diguanylate cyclase (GGDEF)-like protein/PAS domain S-box-containing protein